MVGPSECAGPARPMPFVCQCRWPGRDSAGSLRPMGAQGAPRCLVPRVPPGAQVPNGSQRTVNGPLTDPLTGNGRIPPLAR